MQTEKRCPSCEETKPATEFAKNGKSRDGLNWQCRKCHSLRLKRKRIEYTAINSINDDRPAEKHCPDCKQVKPGSDFSSNVAQSDGLNVVCRLCDRVRNKRRVEKYRSRPVVSIPAAKVCGHCRNEKPSAEFRKNGSAKDGLSSVCNVCADASRSTTMKRYRKENLNRDAYADLTKKACPKCLESKDRVEFGLDRNRHDGLCLVCRRCKKAKDNEWARKNKARVLFTSAKRRANALGLQFDIDVTDVVIPENCPVFGTEFVLGDRERSPSLDRIKPDSGYIKGNVIVVSLRANRLKSDATLEELRKLVAFYEQHIY